MSLSLLFLCEGGRISSPAVSEISIITIASIFFSALALSHRRHEQRPWLLSYLSTSAFFRKKSETLQQLVTSRAAAKVSNLNLMIMIWFLCASRRPDLHFPLGSSSLFLPRNEFENFSYKSWERLGDCCLDLIVLSHSHPSFWNFFWGRSDYW